MKRSSQEPNKVAGLESGGPSQNPLNDHLLLDPNIAQAYDQKHVTMSNWFSPKHSKTKPTMIPATIDLLRGENKVMKRVLYQSKGGPSIP